jgi:hypothetical protein
MNAYAASHLSANHLSITATNVDATLLQSLLSECRVPMTSETLEPLEKSVYHGGEERVDTGVGSTCYYGIAFEAPAKDAKLEQAARVLSAIMEGTPSVKHGHPSSVFRETVRNNVYLMILGWSQSYRILQCIH